MTTFHEYSVTLTEGQQDKLKQKTKDRLGKEHG